MPLSHKYQVAQLKVVVEDFKNTNLALVKALDDSTARHRAEVLSHDQTKKRFELLEKMNEQRRIANAYLEKQVDAYKNALLALLGADL